MILILELPKELEASLEKSAKNRGKVLSQVAIEAMQNYVREDATLAFEESDPLLRLAEECWKGVAEEDAENWPVDFAENFKHYLHGSRKTNE